MLKETVDKIVPVCSTSRKEAREHMGQLIMPVGALGRIMDLSEDLAGIYRVSRPSVEKCAIVVFAGDHGVSAEKGVSAFPSEVTPQMTGAIVNGIAGVNALSMASNSPVFVVDVGVNADLSPLESARGQENIAQIFHDKKIRNGTSNFTTGPAMSRDEAIQSLEVGIEMAKKFSNDYDVLAAGEVGIGNTTASSAIISVLSEMTPEFTTGRGTGIEDLEPKILAIEKGIELNKPDKRDGIDVLSKVGGFEIGAMAGFYLGCAANKVPVVLDGFISSAAALIAYNISPDSIGYMIGSHLSKERGHKLAMESLWSEPYFDYELRLGEGTGAVMMFPVIKAASNMMNNMATFEEAAVAGSK